MAHLPAVLRPTPRAMRARRALLALAMAIGLLLVAAPSGHAATVSGTAVRDDWGVTWQECDSAVANVSIAVGSTKVASVPCNPQTGAFSATGLTIPATTLVTVYFDGALTRGAAYTVSAGAGANVTGLVVMQNDVSVRSEAVAGTVSDTDLQPYDATRDTDLPFDASVWPARTSTGVGMHVRGDDTFYPGNHGVSTDSVDVMPGATLTTPIARTLELRGSGTAPCEFETGVQRPLCVRAGATFTSVGDSGPTFSGTGTFAIEALTYSSLFIQGGASSLAILGTAPGQTLYATYRMWVSSPTTSDPNSTNVVAGNLSTATGAGIEVNSTWTGTGLFTITSTNTFRGNGLLDLPGASVTVTPSISRFTLGDSARRWSMRNLTIGGTYQRSAQAGTATGASPGVNSGGTNLDETIGVWIANGEHLEVANVGANGGDIALMMHATSATPASTTWDDQAPWPTDADPMLLLGTPGANDVATGFTSLPVGTCTYGGVVVYGSSNGDFAMWALCWDPYSRGISRANIFNGASTWTWDGGGANDTIRRADFTPWFSQATMLVAGTTGSSEFRVLKLTTATATITSNVSWNNGGAGAEMFGSCGSAGGIMFVGRTGAPGSRDWAARLYDTATDTWSSNADATIVWDAGGGSDQATSCYDTSGRIFLFGVGRPGVDDDLRVRAYDTSSGTVSTSWATAGTLTIVNAGADVPHAMLGDNGAFFIGSENATAGGRGEVRHVDPDGDVDTTFGANGVAAWNPTGGRDAVLSLTLDATGTQLVLGATNGNNGGDAVIKYLDLMGDDLDAVEPGRTSIQLASGGLSVEQDLQVGTVADPGTPIIDAESYDASVAIGGSMNVRTTGGYRASSVRRLSLQDDLTVRGMFDPGLGRVDITGAARASTLDLAATTTFRDLVIKGRDKKVSVVPGNALRVLRSLTIAGASCAEPVTLQSTVGGTPFTLDAAAGITTSLTNLAVQDSTVTTTPLSSASGRSISGNTNWTLAGCGASSTPAPDQMQVDGVAHAVGVGTSSPVLSWRNQLGASVDKADVELRSSSPDGQVALWRFDGDGSDASGNGQTLTPSGTVSYAAAAFGSGAIVGGTAGTDKLTTAAGAPYDVDAFTVDGWVRFDPAMTGGTQRDVVRHCNGGWNTCNVHLWIQSGSLWLDSYSPGNVGFGTSVNIASRLDGGWHHVAATIGDGHGAMYIDGVQVWTADNGLMGAATALVHPGTPLVVGDGLGSGLDDLRILDYAASPSEVRGFYRTGRRHMDLVWDFDPSDVNGTAIGSTIANGARASIAYGGGASSIRLDGARYSVRARVKSTVGTWSDWSGYDWFETAQSLVVSIPSGQTLTMGSTSVAADDVTNTLGIDVTTNSIHGYSVSLSGPSDTWAMSDGVPGATHEFGGWATPATPTVWPAGTSGFFGVSVLSATGGKDTARWGTGTLPTDFATNKYGWAKATQPLLLHNRPVYDPTAQHITLGLRANAAPGMSPGAFATTLTITVVPNV